MYLILAALGRELSSLEKMLLQSCRVVKDKTPVVEGRLGQARVALAQVGIGRQRSKESAARLMLQYAPAAVISLGFAGAVTPELRAGDLLVCPNVYRFDQTVGNRGSQIGATIPSDRRLLDAAREALATEPILHYSGDLLTVEEEVGSPAFKGWISSTFPVKAVDMESYWVGEVALSKHVPFLAVRAISDTLNDGLPQYNKFMGPEGEVRPLQAVSYFLTKPHQISLAARLAQNARHASHSLSIFATAFVEHLSGVAAEP